MIGLLILILVLVIIAVVVKWFIDYMEVDPPLRKIILAITGLLLLLCFLHELGLFGTGPILVIR